MKKKELERDIKRILSEPERGYVSIQGKLTYNLCKLIKSLSSELSALKKENKELEKKVKNKPITTHELQKTNPFDFKCTCELCRVRKDKFETIKSLTNQISKLQAELKDKDKIIQNWKKVEDLE